MDFQEKIHAELEEQGDKWERRRKDARTRAPKLIRGFLPVTAFLALAAAVESFLMALLGYSVMAALASAYPHLILSALLFALYRVIALLERERPTR